MRPSSSEPAAAAPEARPTDPGELAIITVTYHPDLAILAAQQQALPQAALKILVDNASDGETCRALRQFAADASKTALIENGVNKGLAAALNQGAEHALQALAGCRLLLFLDQDTEPPEGGVAALLHSYEQLQRQDRNPGCIGPSLTDVTTGLEHGFHRIEGWRWVRRFPARDDDPIECDNLNCSGTLVSTRVFTQLQGFEENFFVDHLDTEWAFRVKAAGLGLFGIPGVSFKHRMGQSSWRIWMGRWRIWPYRTPQRHFMLFRNAVRLMRRGYVPLVWKFWAAIKLLLTACVHLFLDARRWEQLRCMSKGVWAGLRAQGTPVRT